MDVVPGGPDHTYIVDSIGVEDRPAGWKARKQRTEGGQRSYDDLWRLIAEVRQLALSAGAGAGQVGQRQPLTEVYPGTQVGRCFM